MGLLSLVFGFLSTPSARRATRHRWKYLDRLRFLSTPSARRATSGRCPRPRPDRYFYPRPPRGGRQSRPTRLSGCPYFYPRPPRGGRLSVSEMQSRIDKFLSTPSARRATLCNIDHGQPPTISIHALREEGDLLNADLSLVVGDFYPRPPRGGRRCDHCLEATDAWISIHALREEGDAKMAKVDGAHIKISIHALREEGDFEC